MNDPVGPALTPAEWKAARAAPGGDAPSLLLRKLHEERGADAARHAQAALALLDRPFGFTWEDVDRCVELAVRDEEVAALQWVRQYRSGWRDLAERIAALLPPRMAAVPVQDSRDDAASA